MALVWLAITWLAVWLLAVAWLSVRGPVALGRALVCLLRLLRIVAPLAWGRTCTIRRLEMTLVAGEAHDED